MKIKGFDLSQLAQICNHECSEEIILCDFENSWTYEQIIDILFDAIGLYRFCFSQT